MFNVQVDLVHSSEESYQRFRIIIDQDSGRRCWRVRSLLRYKQISSMLGFSSPSKDFPKLQDAQREMASSEWLLGLTEKILLEMLYHNHKIHLLDASRRRVTFHHLFQEHFDLPLLLTRNIDQIFNVATAISHEGRKEIPHIRITSPEELGNIIDACFRLSGVIAIDQSGIWRMGKRIWRGRWWYWWMSSQGSSFATSSTSRRVGGRGTSNVGRSRRTWCPWLSSRPWWVRRRYGSMRGCPYACLFHTFGRWRCGQRRISCLMKNKR